MENNKVKVAVKNPCIQNYTTVRKDRPLGIQDRPILEEEKTDDSITGSDHGILNWDTPRRVPPNAEPSSPDVSLSSASLITSCSWQTLSMLSSDHLPILIRLQMKTIPKPGLRQTYVNLKKANWDRYRQEVDAALSKRSLPTDCQRDEKIFRTILLKAASHHIPLEAQTPQGTSRNTGRDDQTKYLGPRVIEYITALFNSLSPIVIWKAIWKSLLIIPIPKPGKCTSQGSSYRPISLLCPAAKVPETLILPTINKYLLPATDQHRFRQEHLTTSAMLKLTTDIAMGFNQGKPPDRTVCVAVDLSAAFDTVCHNNLLSKINKSHLPTATSRWLSCYLRGRQVKICIKGVKSPSRKVNTVVSQGSKLSPSMFSFYIADMSMPTEPVQRVCYADDITVWATGVNIPDMEDSLNSYLEEITAYLKDNTLLITAPKSSVTLFTPDTRPKPTRKYSSRNHSYLWYCTMPKDFRGPPGHLIIIQ